jgi:hypothetical protein
MENKNGHLTLSNIMLLIFLIRTPKKYLINMLEKISLSKNIKSKEQIEEKLRKINKIHHINKINDEQILFNDIISNKIIYVEPIISWKKYGLKANAHSSALFNELMNIDINDNYFIYNENSNKIIFNIIKSKIKKIKEKGSSTFLALYFNKELNRMISVSIGNILYSILREDNSRKYEIIYISEEQYHDINIPYQVSSLNQDYKCINVQYHNINVNDIIIVSNSEKAIFSYNEFINIKNEHNVNFFDLLKKNEQRRNVYLTEYKIIEEQNNNFGINDNASTFSTSFES